jgi:hypothetical protein
LQHFVRVPLVRSVTRSLHRDVKAIDLRVFMLGKLTVRILNFCLPVFRILVTFLPIRTPMYSSEEGELNHHAAPVAGLLRKMPSSPAADDAANINSPRLRARLNQRKVHS